MIKHLSDRAKQIIGICMLITMPILLFAGVIFGQKIDKEEKAGPKQEEAAEQQKQQVEEDSVNEDTSDASFAEEDDNESKAIYEPTDKEKKDAESTAVNFIKAYHSYDAKNPDEYLKKSKKFMTSDLYDFYKQLPKRGTLDQTKVVVKDTSATPGDFQEIAQIWNVDVTSEDTDSNGKKKSNVTPYSIQVQKVNGEWLVSGVRVDG
ncbi:hypothetical protein JNUCC24_19410 (plasmid) [Bacillus sp. JNUCC-24]|uniref:hypothetical protein n=1 Tax=Bacillus sp. JNUCC-24 TaxID=2842458 RepID=UPI001C0B5770|nr:hypothetical protein [Bacillus sp. JNUCC-24]QWS52499.1 hypothetical protein JNUCC24_19410 [Bacillus sp. JNUCC-24]